MPYFSLKFPKFPRQGVQIYTLITKCLLPHHRQHWSLFFPPSKGLLLAIINKNIRKSKINSFLPTQNIPTWYLSFDVTLLSVQQNLWMSVTFQANLLGLDHENEIDSDPGLERLIIQYKRETLLFMNTVGGATSLRSTGKVQKQHKRRPGEQSERLQESSNIWVGFWTMSRSWPEKVEQGRHSPGTGNSCWSLQLL